jgi:hypothetical protein
MTPAVRCHWPGWAGLIFSERIHRVKHEPGQVGRVRAGRGGVKRVQRFTWVWVLGIRVGVRCLAVCVYAGSCESDFSIGGTWLGLTSQGYQPAPGGDRTGVGSP